MPRSNNIIYPEASVMITVNQFNLVAVKMGILKAANIRH